MLIIKLRLYTYFFFGDSTASFNRRIASIKKKERKRDSYLIFNPQTSNIICKFLPKRLPNFV